MKNKLVKCPNCRCKITVSKNKCCENKALSRLRDLLDDFDMRMDEHKELLHNFANMVFPKMRDVDPKLANAAYNLLIWLDEDDEKHNVTRNWKNEISVKDAKKIMKGKSKTNRRKNENNK